MNCEIIAVGEEVLTGDIVNTNGQAIAAGLCDAGIRVIRQTVVGDDDAAIRTALREAVERAEIVVTIGGLGPTYDDITKEAAAEAMGAALRRNPAVEADIRAYFAAVGRIPTENNWKQADLPEGGEVLPNSNGTAPGVWLERDGRVLIQLPGPPRECLPMFRDYALPRLARRTGQVRLTRTVRLYGIPEATAEDRLHEQMLAAENPTIAPYVSDGEVQIRLRAVAGSTKEAEALIRPRLEEIQAIFGESAYSTDGRDLAETLVALLREKGLRVTTAESCTGGLAAAAITAVPGASEVFDGGLCTYAEVQKVALLGVSPKTLAEHTAVSEACAVEMARGARERMDADIAVSVTGYAGPDGGADGTPVGTVCFGISSCWGDRSLTRVFHTGGSMARAINRTRATKEALFQLLREARRF